MGSVLLRNPVQRASGSLLGACSLLPAAKGVVEGLSLVK